MIIIVIDNVCIAIYELEKNSPITGYIYSIVVFFISLKFVQIRSWIIHIQYFICGIQSVKNSLKPSRLVRLNALLLPRIEIFLKTFMLK